MPGNKTGDQSMKGYPSSNGEFEDAHMIEDDITDDRLREVFRHCYIYIQFINSYLDSETELVRVILKLDVFMLLLILILSLLKVIRSVTHRPSLEL